MSGELDYKCEEKGCGETGSACHLSYYDDVNEKTVNEIHYYCNEHATLNGYCWGCGEFWAGCGTFDFEPSGLCDNCRDDPDFGFVEEYDEESLFMGWDLANEDY